MDALELGDKIRSVDPVTGAPCFSEVYLFGHRDSDTSADYVTLELHCPTRAETPVQSPGSKLPRKVIPRGVSGQSSGNNAGRKADDEMLPNFETPLNGSQNQPGEKLAVKLTPGHFIPVAQPSARGWGAHRLVPAARVRAGERAWAAAPDGVRLCHVHRVLASPSKGLFNPYTKNGLLVVDGVVTSAHSDWFLERFVPLAYEHVVPFLYQTLLSPVRELYGLLGPVIARHVEEDWGLVELLARGRTEPFKQWLTSR